MTLELARRPEDFRVDEVALREPEGAGEHTYVWVEKTGVTTEAVALALAEHAGVESRAIGYAGRKDRHAVARQWFSVPGLDPDAAASFELTSARVLRAVRGREKLRTGQLCANDFELVVYGPSTDRLERVRARARELRRSGMPNRFGGQRFGGDGRNASRGRELLRGERRRRGHRDDRFYLSAWQSLLFNRVLAERPAIDRLEMGDIAYDHRDGRTRRIDDPAAFESLLAELAVSPSGPLFGTRAPLASGAPGERERAVLASEGFAAPAAIRPPRGVRLPGARRPLRVDPGAVEVRVEAPCRWLLRFRLPPGSYATVLVEELFGDRDLRIGASG